MTAMHHSMKESKAGQLSIARALHPPVSENVAIR